MYNLFLFLPRLVHKKIEHKHNSDDDSLFRMIRVGKVTTDMGWIGEIRCIVGGQTIVAVVLGDTLVISHAVMRIWIVVGWIGI